MDSKIIDRFCLAKLTTFARNLCPDFSEQRALKEIREEFLEDLELNKPDVLERRKQYYDFKNINTKDYLNRAIPLDSKRSVFAGIRHVGGHAEKPFISAWLNYPLTNWEEVEELREVLPPLFAKFHPLHVALWADPHSFVGKQLTSLAEPTQQIVMGLTQNIAHLILPKPSRGKDLELESVTDQSYRPWYNNVCNSFEAERPDLIPWVPRNSEETMNKSIQEGLIALGKLKGETLGIISGEHIDILGMKGLYLNEILIDPKFKRLGWAKYLEQKFIQLFGKEYDVVWGTIDAKNLPSLKTAKSLGRQVVCTQFFVPLNLS